MALSNSQYNAIMREYERRQIDSRHDREKRVEEIYRKIPAIREIDSELSIHLVYHRDLHFTNYLHSFIHLMIEEIEQENVFAAQYVLRQFDARPIT